CRGAPGAIGRRPREQDRGGGPQGGARGVASPAQARGRSVTSAPSVLSRIPGQDRAMEFLTRAASRPHHAYLMAGPEGSGKQLAARAFAAALLCVDGGCGECRTCVLALGDRHPNVFIVEPEGRDIHVDTVRDEVWHPAYRTAPE